MSKSTKSGKVKISGRLADHLIQGFLIFASVFLAFWLNDYRISVSERQATDRALAAVVSEVQSNRDILQRWAPYHREVSDGVLGWLQERDPVQRGANDGDAFDPYDFLDDRGVFREILTYDSWDLIRQTDVRLDVDVRLAVNRIFRQQEYVDGAVEAAVGFLGGRDLLDSARSHENAVIFYRLMAELYGQQTAMLRSYEVFLDDIRERE